MKNLIILYKGYEILHRHTFYNIYFTAWKGTKMTMREIRKDSRLINWDNPLTEEEKEFLIGRD